MGILRSSTPGVGLTLSVPGNYTSGDVLAISQDIYANTTLAALGVTPGQVFRWSWGPTADQSFTINTTGAGPAQSPTYVNLGFFGLGSSAQPLLSWDISWVDSKSQLSDGYPLVPIGNDFYYLADRSNKAIDVVPIENNPPIFFVTSPTAPFAGLSGNNNTAGPNGVMTFQNPAGAFGGNASQLWVGDGPTADPHCMAATGTPVCSTVKVFAGNNAARLFTIPAGNGKPGTVGVNRADELCYDDKDGIVLVANDADSPPFDTFISTRTGQVLARVDQHQLGDLSGLSSGLDLGARSQPGCQLLAQKRRARVDSRGCKDSLRLSTSCGRESR